MKISYNWLKEYLPKEEVFAHYVNSVEKLSAILTSVGLEVEALEVYESVPGGLEGLIVGEVLTCIKHPNADRLRLTTVNTGKEILQVVCGAPNVAAGQKVILAQPGVKIFPFKDEPFTIKKSKIRGEESNGMICSEDEVGLGPAHEGIVVLDANAVPGTPVQQLFNIQKDHTFEIGLTPNRMDDQSHLGVAKDICAWLSHHTGHKANINSPLGAPFSVQEHSFKIDVEIKNPQLCSRYAGVVVSGVTITDSPEWLQNRLKSLGMKPINNVVDITNFILHTTGQPLHAFDADKIGKNRIIVETLKEGTPFTTLDEKQRKLSAEDILICDGNNTPMCIAGVFGGIETGVTASSKNIFIESAVFNPVNIRKTMIRHDLRTDAASRFEKGVDVGKSVEVLKYAANLISDLGKGKIASEIVDVFHKPEDRVIDLSFGYLKKLSGKEFRAESVVGILSSLGFVIKNKNEKSITVVAPASNPDISLPADVVEEILRIDGLDNIEIPKAVTMVPGSNDRSVEFNFYEKLASWLTGNGFREIFTNSITSDRNTEPDDVPVRIMNSLSEDLTILRTHMLPEGLESIAYNLNRQNKDLLFFEFGKTYSAADDKYYEKNHLSLYCTGDYQKKSWRGAEKAVDIYFMKGIAQSIFALAGINCETKTDANGSIAFLFEKEEIGKAFEVSKNKLEISGIRQPVFSLDLNIDLLKEVALSQIVKYKPVSKFPSVTRDIAMIIDKEISFGEIEKTIHDSGLKKLTGIRMFDLYESDKLGANKKSIALSLSFADEQKTLTDEETDTMMQKAIRALSKQVNAEIRTHA